MAIEIRDVHRALKSRRLRHHQEVRHLRSPIHVSKTFTKWSARRRIDVQEDPLVWELVKVGLQRHLVSRRHKSHMAYHQEERFALRADMVAA